MSSNINNNVPASTPASDTHVFSDHSYGSALTKEFESMYNSDHMTDVTLLTSDGGEFKAHSLLLSAASPYFKAQFTHDSKPAIDICNITADVLHIIIKYMYSGQARFCASNVCQVLEAADYFEFCRMLHRT